VRGAGEIANDLAELPQTYRQRVRRVFLADGNALAMDTTQLKDTLDVLRGDLPNLDRVGE